MQNNQQIDHTTLRQQLTPQIVSVFMAAAISFFSISSVCHAAQTQPISNPAADNAQKQELTYQQSVEERITDRMASKLSRVLNEDLFRIIVSAKVKSVSEKILLEGETASQINEKNRPKDSSVQALPGFQRVAKPDDKTPQKSQKQVKSKYRYRTYDKLEKVYINLLLDQDLPEPSLAMAKSIIEQDIATNIGDVAELSVSSLPIVEKDLSFFESLNAWLTKYIVDRGGSGIDLVFFVLIGLLVLFLLITWMRQLLSLFKKSNAPAQTSGEGKKDPKEIEDNINQIIDRLVRQVAGNPMAVSSFLKQLGKEAKEVILEATKTPALRSHFCHLMNIAHNPTNYKGDSKSPTGGDKIALFTQLSNIEKDLERYLTLQDQLVKKRFGYLTYLPDSTIVEFLDQSPNKTENLAILARFLSKSQFEAVCSHLDSGTKAELFKQMKLAQAKPEKLDLLDEQLRLQYERLNDQSSMFAKNETEMEREFFENADNVAELIDSMKQQNIPLSPGYEKYLVTFDKLTNLDDDVMKIVFSSVSNETLAKAYAKSTFAPNIKAVLGEIRAKLIASTRNRYLNAPLSEIKRAQKEVLKAYWNLT